MHYNFVSFKTSSAKVGEISQDRFSYDRYVLLVHYQRLHAINMSLKEMKKVGIEDLADFPCEKYSKSHRLLTPITREERFQSITEQR